ncbi:MAG: GNAT family N-acetyltransferase [Paludibacteraceae bacterium]|nr:GNAT family N-acetyltransferase [Paludibacteraceae bacterium]
MQDDGIIGGIGVCVNDDHDRPDLTPNICHLWVEPAFRGKGLAGQLLATAETDMRSRGIQTLYLVTEHTGFYERYGWSFVTTVRWKYADPAHSRVYKKNL